MIAIVGGLLAALGFLAGGLLLAGPLGLVPPDVGVALGILFPVLTVIGWFLMILGGRQPALLAFMRVLAGLLLLLSLCAAGALVAVAAGAVAPQGINGSLPLWVVLGLGAIVGVAGLAAARRKAQPELPA